MTLIDIVHHFSDTKQAIVNVTGFARPMLHFLVGAALTLAVTAALRDRIRASSTFSTVLSVAISAEILDRIHKGSWNWQDSLCDVLLTTLLPAITLGIGMALRTYQPQSQI